MNKLKYLISGSSLLLGTVTVSAAEFSGQVTLATDYVYRGISQTREEPTIQGGFDVDSDLGLYAGVWGSNVAFDGSIELDYYAGFGGNAGEAFDYDVGVIYYHYPNQPRGQADSDFTEVYGNVSYKDLTAGMAVSNDFFGETGNATYLTLDYVLTLANDFALGFHYGTQKIDDATDYDEYSVSLSRTLADIDLSLSWHDTDLSRDDCGGTDDCEGRVVFGLSKRL